jgi:hypothetical protein
MWVEVLHNEDSAHVLIRVFIGLHNLHDFDDIFGHSVIQLHGKVDHLVMSLLVIGRLPQLEVHTLLVLVDPVESELREIVREDAISIVEPDAPELDLKPRRFLKVHRRRLVGLLQLLDES